MDLAKVVFFGRTGEEALQFFDLEWEALKGRRLLDCPGGPGAFTALARRHGVEVIAVDPLYGLPPEELERQALADIGLHNERASGADHLRPDFDLDLYHRGKRGALASFLSDRRAHPESYLAASLPELPFSDGSFDLVLSAHLLFGYSPLQDGGLYANSPFDLAWHRRALAELRRVSRGEVRLYPVHTVSRPARLHPYVEALLAELPAPWSGRLFHPSYDQGFEGETPGLLLRRPGSTAHGVSAEGARP
ncbi:class I SAM-dependent methyltransferase [Cyanobium sp. Morenito 9A2]|uniref:class I SAM-dependent methyltransferase n=1 Tax=Cyanobium sp. Morenito 9A2 TaxID=2823718 RepID=UPI0020CF3171|nr:class I SAM-dependent methyltransferase [Cyanobium sp. Morenito 9A2]MCP9848698.1 class I SAM-dependent methyltransferase [Cyanobium sp. Morenito 9A2]